MSRPPRGRDGGRILRPPGLELSPSPEPPSPELIPKDAVLYQYAACPLCNKVKGGSKTNLANLAVFGVVRPMHP
ncbi:hypothetical protein C4D60_Mb04t33030 [Musa balbisiana]|uniref:GST N-terminal domain-containing protein n=1 Tax=Musa balbisiana TaxID=52838 RepID=A0A4S8KH02_MUSBA|nr:hypothetical protein C4D60_Mb04t33030 [Musa balbisiana]